MNSTQATQHPAPQPSLRLLERPARAAGVPPATPATSWFHRLVARIRGAG